MFRRHREPARPRTPHPDPRAEAELQRILSLRRTVARKEALLDQDRENIRRLRNKARRTAGDPFTDDVLDQADDLLEETAELEAEVAELHDRIEKRMSLLSDDDLAYL